MLTLTSAIVLSTIVALANCQPDYCALKPETGSCRGYFTQWAFNPTLGRCVTFIWGGCNDRFSNYTGPRNRFRNETSCLETCAPRQGGRTFEPWTTAPPTTVQANLPAECYDRPDPGNGPDMILSYFYDARTKKCSLFTWTGRGGNYNNFQTAEECLSFCQPYDDTYDNNNDNGDNNNNNDGSQSRSLPSNRQQRCDECLIGRCTDAKNAPSYYNLTTSFLQIYLGLQVQCAGEIQSIKFIDVRPKASKTFYLSVWDIEGLGAFRTDPITGVVSTNVAAIRLTLVKVIQLRSTNQTGWQEINTAAQKIRVLAGQYVGVHMPSWMTLQEDCVIPYSYQADSMPTIAIRADHNSLLSTIRAGLPRTLPNLLSDTSSFQIDLRRPALLINVKADPLDDDGRVGAL